MVRKIVTVYCNNTDNKISHNREAPCKYSNNLWLKLRNNKNSNEIGGEH